MNTTIKLKCCISMNGLIKNRSNDNILAILQYIFISSTLIFLEQSRVKRLNYFFDDGTSSSSESLRGISTAELKLIFYKTQQLSLKHSIRTTYTFLWMVGYNRKFCSVFVLFIWETSVGILYPIIVQFCKSLVLNISDFLKSPWYILIMNCFQLNTLLEYYVFSIILQSKKEVHSCFQSARTR